MKDIVKLHNDWSNIPFKQSPQYIYHYTSQMGLDGIFSNQQLWANDIYRQNDKSEGIYVLDLLKNNIASLCSDKRIKDAILKEVERLRPELVDGFCYSEKYRSFIISFSTEPDELALWNYYTKDANAVGYNIQFEVNALASCLSTMKNKKEKNGTVRRYYNNIKCRHGKIFYNPKEQLGILKHIIQDFSKFYTEIDDTWVYLMIDKILWVGTFFKSPYFKHEYEYRFAFFTQTDKSMLDGYDVPIEIEGKVKNHIEIQYETNSIHKVICSPTNSEEQLKYPEKYMSSHYPNFKSVKMSNIPFRII